MKIATTTTGALTTPATHRLGGATLQSISLLQDAHLLISFVKASQPAALATRPLALVILSPFVMTLTLAPKTHATAQPRLVATVESLTANTKERHLKAGWELMEVNSLIFMRIHPSQKILIPQKQLQVFLRSQPIEQIFLVRSSQHTLLRLSPAITPFGWHPTTWVNFISAQITILPTSDALPRSTVGQECAIGEDTTARSQTQSA
mmetsp:Transcript_9380/g.13054  ORF Transcript_9380/g.13054 Transcript_9380/m.13054 type:complete len:206 (-) Transcript_9380:21-638(-)